MREMVIDNFAGAGGASLGIERALGVPVDIAINHDEAAIEMHKANHPHTRHLCEDIWSVDPLEATAGRPVGLAWFSPDCTHFSRAKGGKPVEKKIRGLAWVAVRWAKTVRPRVIILENVAEFQEWGPLTKKNRPHKKKKGETFNIWMSSLLRMGYEVEWRELMAADYGAPTIRKRLFLIARCDGQPIVWPSPTHGAGLKPHRAAAECIDWSIPCPSIFERKKPLVENTLKRIARGMQRFVFEAKEPFILVNTTGNPPTGVSKPLKTITTGNHHYLITPYLSGIDHKGSNSTCIWPAGAPERAITKENRFALISPLLAKYHGQKTRESRCHPVDKPIYTIDTSNRFALVTAFLSKYYTGVVGSKLDRPVPTVTAIDHNALIATHLTKFYGTNTGSDMRKPMPTITASGQHIGEVRAFLVKYYGTNTGQDLKNPMHTVTGKHRFGLVTVEGQQYQVADIGLRMLAPRELARAQGLPDSYILTGTKANQVAKIGNSICPILAEVLVGANIKLRKLNVA